MEGLVPALPSVISQEQWWWFRLAQSPAQKQAILIQLDSAYPIESRPRRVGGGRAVPCGLGAREPSSCSFKARPAFAYLIRQTAEGRGRAF